MRRVLAKVPSEVKNIGSFIKDNNDGELTDSVLNMLQEDKQIVDMAPFFSSVAQIKLDCER